MSIGGVYVHAELCGVSYLSDFPDGGLVWVICYLHAERCQQRRLRAEEDVVQRVFERLRHTHNSTVVRIRPSHRTIEIARDYVGGATQNNVVKQRNQPI